MYLHRPDIAQIVVNSERLMKSLKGASAREANRVSGRIGEQFWQKESYDPWVRNPQDYPLSSAGVETSLDAARRVRAPR